MNVVFLSPQFPSNFYHFCTRLHVNGIHVLGIDQQPYEQLGHALQSSLRGYYRVNDLHNYSELENALHYFVNTHGPIHYIESHNEYWLETQAKLASQFQIPGLKNEQIQDIKCKSRMKKIFLDANLNPARGAIVHTLDEATKLANSLGYPLMLKPDVGVGANGCCKVQTQAELCDFFSKKPSQEYLMEEFIKGKIFSFDGLVDKNGDILFCTSHVYGAGIAEVVHHHLDQVYYSLRTIPADLEAMGRKTLLAYGVKERFFHLEFFRRESDQSLIPIEVNMRPPGGPTLDMCNFACDIDLYDLWAKMIANNSSTFSFERKFHCMSISRRYKNSYTHTHEEILDKGRGLIVHHDTVSPLCYGTMGNFFYLARSPDLEELNALQRYIHA